MTMENLAAGKKWEVRMFSMIFLFEFSPCQDLNKNKTQQSTWCLTYFELWILEYYPFSSAVGPITPGLVIMLREQRIIRINFTASTTAHFITVPQIIPPTVICTIGTILPIYIIWNRNKSLHGKIHRGPWWINLARFIVRNYRELLTSLILIIF